MQGKGWLEELGRVNQDKRGLRRMEARLKAERLIHGRRPGSVQSQGQSCQSWQVGGRVDAGSCPNSTSERPRGRRCPKTEGRSSSQDMIKGMIGQAQVSLCVGVPA